MQSQQLEGLTWFYFTLKKVSSKAKEEKINKRSGATTTEPICVASYSRKGVLFGATPDQMVSFSEKFSLSRLPF